MASPSYLSAVRIRVSGVAMVFVKQMIVFDNLNDAPNWALVVFAELSWVRVSCVIPHSTYHISIGVDCLSHINLVLHPLRYHRLESDMSFRTHNFIGPFRVEMLFPVQK